MLVLFISLSLKLGLKVSNVITDMRMLLQRVLIAAITVITARLLVIVPVLMSEQMLFVVWILGSISS